MMQDSLLVSRILDYVARWHPEQVQKAVTVQGVALTLLQLTTT